MASDLKAKLLKLVEDTKRKEKVDHATEKMVGVIRSVVEVGEAAKKAAQKPSFK